MIDGLYLVLCSIAYYRVSLSLRWWAFDRDDDLYMILHCMLGFSAPVLVSLLVGVWVSEIHSIGRSPIWTLYGAAALHILYYLPTWQGYAGELFMFTQSPYTFCTRIAGIAC